MDSTKPLVRIRVCLEKSKKNPGAVTYMLRWKDPKTGFNRSLDTNTHNLETAHQASAELWKTLTYGDNIDYAPMTWNELQDAINRERESMGEVKRDFHRPIAAIARHCEFQTITTANKSTLRGVIAGLIAEGKSRATIKKYMSDTQVMLDWAYDNGNIPRRVKVPKVTMKETRVRQMRSKPVTREMHNNVCIRILEKRPRHGRQFALMLGLMWHTGLRHGEAMTIAWDNSPIILNMEAKHPRIEFYSEGQKNKTDDVVPLTREAIDFINEHWPERTRHGKLVLLRYEEASKQKVWLKSGRRFGPRILTNQETVADIVREAAKDVGACTNFEGQKTKWATPHDWRRAFATRMSSRVTPQQLARLLRHKNTATAQLYYVFEDCDTLAEEIQGL